MGRLVKAAVGVAVVGVGIGYLTAPEKVNERISDVVGALNEAAKPCTDNKVSSLQPNQVGAFIIKGITVASEASSSRCADVYKDTDATDVIGQVKIEDTVSINCYLPDRLSVTNARPTRPNGGEFGTIRVTADVVQTAVAAGVSACAQGAKIISTS